MENKNDNNKKKRILILLALMLFNLALVSFGTYAFWDIAGDSITGNNSISTGQIKMSYTESNEIKMENAIPLPDDAGKILSDYFDFQVLSYIKTKESDNKKRMLNYNIILEPINVNNPLHDNEIKVYLTKVENGVEKVVVEPITIDKLNNYILKSEEEAFSNNKDRVLTSYRLRAWIDASVDTNKFNEKKYSYRFRVNINNEDAPKEMVPILNIPVGTDGLEQITHTIDDTLQVDGKFATEYRYRGGNVNNYVTFNNEVWRIIGIIPTEDTNGNVENRIKIIKDESIGNMAWNETSSSNWTTATLNTYLNNDYYNTLTTDAKNMIGTTKYFLGGSYDREISSDMMWENERKKSNGSNCVANEDGYTGSECYYYGTNPIMQNDASKKIAIMYTSDYGYAASKECVSVLYLYASSASCKTTNNWLDKSANTWLLSQSTSYDEGCVFHVVEVGSVTDGATVSSVGSAVRPVLSLSSNVKISGGNGTSTNPYTLSIN